MTLRTSASTEGHARDLSFPPHRCWWCPNTPTSLCLLDTGLIYSGCPPRPAPSVIVPRKGGFCSLGGQPHPRYVQAELQDLQVVGSTVLWSWSHSHSPSSTKLIDVCILASHIGPVSCVQPVGLQPDVQCWVVLCMERPSPLNCAFSPSGECAALSLVFTFQKLYILSQEVSHKLITHSRESPLSTPERQQALDSQPPNLLLPGSPSVPGAPAVLNPS